MAWLPMRQKSTKDNIWAINGLHNKLIFNNEEKPVTKISIKCISIWLSNCETIQKDKFVYEQKTTLVITAYRGESQYNINSKNNWKK